MTFIVLQLTYYSNTNKNKDDLNFSTYVNVHTNQTSFCSCVYALALFTIATANDNVLFYVKSIDYLIFC